MEIGLALGLGLQCLVLGLTVWLLFRRNESVISRSLQELSRAHRESDSTRACRLLVTTGRALADHSEQFEDFERTLRSEQTTDLSAVGKMRKSNQDVEQAIETAIAGLVQTCGDALGKEQASLEQYLRKTARFDTTLEGVNRGDLLVRMAGRLVDMVRDLRRENRAVQIELTESKDEIIKLLSRASSAEQTARIDTLTRLLNRRAFEEAYLQCQILHRQTSRPFSLVLIDIDHFKAVNDRYGHAAGDAILCLVARVLRENSKTSDHVARLGGEEFAVLLPGCEGAWAMSVADRYRRKIESSVLRHEGHELSVTVSCGVAQAEPDQSQADLLKRADTALYEAKASGRNQTCDAADIRYTNGDLATDPPISSSV